MRKKPVWCSLYGRLDQARTIMTSTPLESGSLSPRAAREAIENSHSADGDINPSPDVVSFRSWRRYDSPFTIDFDGGQVRVSPVALRYACQPDKMDKAQQLVESFWANHHRDILSHFYNLSLTALKDIPASCLGMGTTDGVWTPLDPHPFNFYSNRLTPISLVEENTLNYKTGDLATYRNSCSRLGRMRLKELAAIRDFDECFCQVHYKPLGVYPGPGTLHPTIQSAWLQEAITCHADQHVRQKDQEFLKLALKVLKSIEVHSAVNLPTRSLNRWKKEVSKFRSRNSASYYDFGQGYCYLKKIAPKYRWPVARLLGPDPYIRDVEPFVILCQNTKFEITSLLIEGSTLHLSGRDCEEDTSSYPFGWANHLRVGAKNNDTDVKLDKNQRRIRNSLILANCAANNANNGSVDKAARFEAHQRHIARYSRRQHDLLTDVSPKKMTKLSMVKNSKIKTGYRIIGTKITDNKITVVDDNGIVHGQLLFPMRKGFKMRSVAGDHGCGAAIYNIQKKDVEIIKRRMHTLPTGGRHWDSKILSNADLQGVSQLNWKDSIDSSMANELDPRSRIASLGQGNHFCHIVRKENDYKLVVHVGSRGMFSEALPYLKSTLGERPTHEFYSLMQTCESFAHLNRDAIANYLVTGKLTDDGTLLNGEHFPHTRFDMIGSVPVIQKNIIKNKKKSNKNLILGSPSGGVGFVSSDERYLIHGSGPDPAVTGGFLNPETITGDVWVSVFNFDRHTAGGGSYQMMEGIPPPLNSIVNLEPKYTGFPLVDTKTSLVALQGKKVGTKQTSGEAKQRNGGPLYVDAFSLPVIQSEYISDDLVNP